MKSNIYLKITFFFNLCFPLFVFGSNEFISVPAKSIEYFQPVHEQLSCTHMQRRFMKVKELLNSKNYRDYFLNNKNVKNSNNVDYSFFDYIMYKLNLSRNIEFSLLSMRVKGSINVSHLPEHIDGWLIRSFSRNEYTQNQIFEHLPGSVKVVSDKVELIMDLPIGIACLEQKVEFVALSQCPYSLINIGYCDDDSCLKFKAFNWNKCKIKKQFNLDLEPLLMDIGKTKREMKRLR